MPKPVKVFNKGTRPVVFKRDRKGVEAIHPGKFFLFDPENAKSIIDKFEDACSEEEYKKILAAKEEAKKKDKIEAEKEAKANKKAKEEAKKQTETTG